MDLMISINPPYTKMIFEGYKKYEFRKQILKYLKTNGYKPVRCFIYETLNKGGLGKIIGEVQITCTHSLMYYRDSKGVAPSLDLINSRKSLNHTIYDDWCLLNKIPAKDCDYNNLSDDFKKYLIKIGFFFNHKKEWDYALKIENPILYEVPLSISDFLNTKGEELKRPPQNMYSVIKK